MRFKQKFLLIAKSSTFRKCLIVLSLLASMFAWFYNRCPFPSISHSSSMSPVLECHNYWNPVYRKDPLLRVFTSVLSLSPHSPLVFPPFSRGTISPSPHRLTAALYYLDAWNTLQYVAQYPAGTSVRPLKTKTQFLRRPFQFSVNEVFQIKAEHFSFKMKVLASL